MGDVVKSDTDTYNVVVATGFTERWLASTESNSESGLASVTVNDSTSSNENLQSTSMSNHVHRAPRHNLIPLPDEQELSASTSNPIPSESAPANNIDSWSKRGKITTDANPKHFDSVSVDIPGESAQSISATSSIPVIIVTCCASRSPSPTIHISPTSCGQSPLALDTITSTTTTASQPSTTQVPSALDQDVHAQLLYKGSDMDLGPDTFSIPSSIPHYHK